MTFLQVEWFQKVKAERVDWVGWIQLFWIYYLHVEMLKTLDTKIKEVQLYRPLVGRGPCIIVFGQNVKIKAILVNELFSQAHLPLMEPEEQQALSWRMVKFKYGKKPQVVKELMMGGECTFFLLESG